MRVKRACAAILCAAIIFSSEGFTASVLADETPQVEVTESQAESEGDDSSSPEETENTEAEATATPVQMPQETEPPQTDTTPEPVESPESPEESPAEFPTSAPPEPPSEVPEETPIKSPDESGSLSPTPSALPEATSSPEVLPTPTQTPDLLVTPTPSSSPMTGGSSSPSISPEILQIDSEFVKASGDCFEVDENGTLRLKDGMKITTSTVSIPDNVKIIPSGIFNDNSLVTKIIFGDNSELTSIAEKAFEGSQIREFSVPAGVTEIARGTFKRSALESITFKGEVTSIGEEAFMGTSIETISIRNVTLIGNGAFANCTKLTTVSTGKLQRIEAYAFENCSLLGSKMLWSDSLAFIGRGAFSGCGFDTLNMSAVNRSNDHDVIIETGAFENCLKLTGALLPEGLAEIPSSLFKGCSRLSNVSLPSSVNGIGGYAFGNCISLKRIVLPENVARIEARAFDGCSALSEIVINYPDTNGKDFYIAENAFPVITSSTVVMKGYDGQVQEYAESKGYRFETLYRKFNIQYRRADHSSLIANVGSAVPGTEIIFTITPEDGYCLVEGSVTLDSNDKNVPVSLVSCADNSQVYRFIMPESDVIINYSITEIANTVKGNLFFDFLPVNNQLVEEDRYNENSYIMKKTGQEAQLSITNESGTKLGAWLFEYKSNNINVVSISDTGRLQACGKGTTTVTASLKNDKNKKIKFTMTVEDDASISALELDFHSPYRAQIKEETIDGKDFTVVEYNKAALSSGPLTFNVSVNAYEDGSKDNLVVATDWASVDTGIASAAKSRSMTNSNTITVKKGTEGETMITVSFKNKDMDELVQESFIVRVVNATPRLTDTKIAVNSLSDRGTAIDVVPVYGYEIEPDGGLEIHVKTEKNGIVDYDHEYPGLVVTRGADGQYYIKATNELELAAGKSITFKGKNQLYLWGRFDNTHAAFTIPIPELTVTNKALAPSVSLSGKINLFYNSTAADSEKGIVTLTQSLKNEIVDRYELVSDANYKKPGSEKDDSFAANFIIRKTADNQKAEITRTSTDMMQVNKKNVTAGYVYIYYKGYTEPVKKRITVPTCNTVPSYVLSTTSATASVYRTQQVYSLQILDKKTKKPISLENISRLNLDYDSSTDGLFDGLDVEQAQQNNAILLQVADTPFKGKAVIYIEMSTWSQGIRFTFNLKTTSTLPTAKLSASSVTLNKYCPSKEAVIASSLNQADSEMRGFDESSLVFTGSKKYQTQAQALIDNMVLGESEITVSLPEGQDIAPATYSFKVKPRAGFEDNAEEKDLVSLKYVSFKVVVSNKKPVIKLKSSTFTLNTHCAGTETVSTTYSVTNLPSNEGYEIIADNDTKLVPVSKSGTPAEDILSNGMLNFENANTNTVSATLADKRFFSSVNSDYYVEGLKLKVGEDAPIPLDRFKVKIKGTLTAPSVKVTAKGTINPVDSSSQIEYTAKVNNVNSGISNITIYELNPITGDYYRENGQKYSKHFTVERDGQNGNKAIVKVKEGERLDAKLTYKIRLVYTLDAEPDVTIKEAAFNIKPKQSLPKIKTDKTSVNLYAGQGTRTTTVKIEKTTASQAIMETPIFAKNTPDAVKKAYKVTDFNPDTGVMTLTLVNPSALVLNKKYTLNFEVRYQNQMENTTGNTFKLNVTVRK